MLHLVSTLFFLLAAAFGLTVISVMVSQNIDRVIAALLMQRPKQDYGRGVIRARFTRA